MNRYIVRTSRRDKDERTTMMLLVRGEEHFQELMKYFNESKKFMYTEISPVEFPNEKYACESCRVRNGKMYGQMINLDI